MNAPKRTCPQCNRSLTRAEYGSYRWDKRRACNTCIPIAANKSHPRDGEPPLPKANPAAPTTTKEAVAILQKRKAGTNNRCERAGAGCKFNSRAAWDRFCAANKEIRLPDWACRVCKVKGVPDNVEIG